MHIEIANIFHVNEAAALFDQYRMFYGKPSDADAAIRFPTDAHRSGRCA